MAEEGRVELPKRFHSPAFRAGAISQTLPLLVVWRREAESNPQGATNARLFSRQLPSPIGLPLHCLAPVDGIEPPLRVLETPVLPLHHTGSGCPSRTRTCDIVINSHPFYQLNYRAIMMVILILCILVTQFTVPSTPAIWGDAVAPVRQFVIVSYLYRCKLFY